MSAAFVLDVAVREADASALLDLRDVRFERHASDLYAIVASDDNAVAAFARAGIRAHPASPPARAAGLLPARVTGLDPLAVEAGVDVVDVRVLHVGEASARAARRQWWRRATREQEARLRSILRGEDRTLAWRRVAWLPRDVLRARAVPGARPIVFDRPTIDAAQETCESVRSCGLARWLAA